MTGRQTVLFVDEVHRFNKAQQDALLPAVENRWVTFIGATTENPFFSVIRPLLSRSLLLTLEPLTDDDIRAVLRRARRRRARPRRRGHARPRGRGPPRPAGRRRRPPGADLPGGRRACSPTTITVEVVEQAVDRAAVRYDREGDQHYDVISAFIKSMRGSDVDAALHYLARMIEAGEDPRFIARRIVILASEDVGMADPDLPADRGRRRPGGGAHRPARGPDQPGPGGDPPGAGAQVQRGRSRRSARPSPTCARGLDRPGPRPPARRPLPGGGEARPRRGLQVPPRLHHGVVAQQYAPERASRGRRYYEPTRHGAEAGSPSAGPGSATSCARHADRAGQR